MTTIKALNDGSLAGFVAAVGFAFEDSPWVAEAAYEWRPFADRTALHAAMVRSVAEAPVAQQVALIAAHPDLAGRVAREGRLTAASSAEQSAAGLDRLDSDERARFETGNAAYRAKFGFPFVICVRGQTKITILNALAARLTNAPETEIATALAEISQIASLRLAEAVPR